MNIAIDIQPLISSSRYRGIGVYTAGLLNEIFAQDNINRYFLFNMYKDRDIDDILSFGSNVSYDFFYMGKNACLLSNNHIENECIPKNEKLIKRLYQRYIKTNKIETFVVTSTLDAWAEYRNEWFEGTNLVVIVYDLIPLIFADEYLVTDRQKEHYQAAIDFWKAADKLLAISKSVKEDLVQYLGIPEEKVDVIYSGANERFAQKRYTKKESKSVLKKFGIKDKFFIFPSAPDFRKNMNRTMEAFASMGESKKYQLVITGKMFPVFYERFTQRIEELAMTGRIILTDYLTEDEMIVLYKNARLLLFPSLYEGFGLPVIEAYLAGLPVVTSDNSSLGEIAAGAAVMVDPTSEHSIAAGIRAALYDTDYTCFEKTICEKIEQFTWKNTAELALDALKKLPPKPIEAQNTFPKLAFFAPIETSNQALKQVYEDAIDELKLYFDVTVFVDGKPKEELCHGVQVCDISEFSAMALDYRERLYHIADLPENLYIAKFMLEFPGRVVLYDNSIKNELLWNENMLQNAKHIYVLSDGIKEKLLWDDVGIPVTKVQPFKELGSRLLHETELERDWIFVGYGARQSEVDCLIEALRQITAAGMSNWEFYLCGTFQEEREKSLREKLQQFELEDKFFLAEDNLFLSYVEKADVCIQIGGPDAGENGRFFLEWLAKASCAISLDRSAKEIVDQGILMIDYANQGVHLKEALSRIMKDASYRKRLIFDKMSVFERRLTIGRAVIGEEDTPVVTEAFLKDIYEKELKPRGLNKDEEYRLLAKTLSFIMLDKMDIQMDEWDKKEQADLRAESIVKAIRKNLINGGENNAHSEGDMV